MWQASRVIISEGWYCVEGVLTDLQFYYMLITYLLFCCL